MQWIAALIISANCGVVTALLAYSGGTDSNLWVLYILPVTAACIMLGRRAAALVTFGALAFISAYYVFAGDGFGPAVWLEVGLKDAVLVFVAFTVARLAGRARSARGEARVQGQLREAAEERSELFRLLLDDSPDAIFIADAATGRLLDCNRGTEDLSGYTRAELSGLCLLDLDAGPFLRRRGWEGIVNRLRELKRVTYETEIRARDGRQRPAEASLGFIALSGREYLTAVVRDVRWRRMAEEERSHGRAMEAAARLAAGVAHGVENLVTSMSGQTTARLEEASPAAGRARAWRPDQGRRARRGAAPIAAGLRGPGRGRAGRIRFGATIERMRESMAP